MKLLRPELVDTDHRPLRMPGNTGLQLVASHGMYLLFNGEERVAVLSADELRAFTEKVKFFLDFDSCL